MAVRMIKALQHAVMLCKMAREPDLFLIAQSALNNTMCITKRCETTASASQQESSPIELSDYGRS